MDWAAYVILLVVRVRQRTFRSEIPSGDDEKVLSEDASGPGWTSWWKVAPAENSGERRIHEPAVI